MLKVLSLTAAFAAAQLALAADPVSLSLQVEPQQENCFYEELYNGQYIEAMAMVYRGGKLDIRLRVEDPNRRILYDQLLFSNIDDGTGAMLNTIVRKGPKLTLEENGVYTFCLDNRMARWTAKVVTFDLSITNPKGDGAIPADPALAPLKDGATEAETAAHQVAFLKSGSSRMHSKLLNLENAQFYHYHREKRHRDTIESTNTRVQFWGIVEGIIVLVLTAGQVILIHTWINNSTRGRGGGGLPRAFSGV